MRRDDATGTAVAPIQDLGARDSPSPGRRPLKLSRFRMGLWVLVGLALISLGLALGLALPGRMSRAPGNWSAWSPPDGGLAGAQEIADYVAPYYRATPSQQLAVISTVNLNDPSHPLHVVVPSAGSGGTLVPLPADSTIVYNLCGVGSSNCAIAAGHPSAARLLLLRREALELALYTFKYISGVNAVVAILPPGHAKQASCVGLCAQFRPPVKTTSVNLAVAFDHAELQPWLDHPLRDLFPEQVPPTVSQMSNAPEAELISILTAHGLFDEHVEQAQDGSSVVVLSPTAPQ